jgi:hypothetical protein
MVAFLVESIISRKASIYPYDGYYTCLIPGIVCVIFGQLDHILVDRLRHSNVLDILSYMAADCDSDHYLVVAKVRERLAVNKKRSQRFNMVRFNLN